MNLNISSPLALITGQRIEALYLRPTHNYCEHIPRQWASSVEVYRRQPGPPSSSGPRSNRMRAEAPVSRRFSSRLLERGGWPTVVHRLRMVESRRLLLFGLRLVCSKLPSPNPAHHAQTRWARGALDRWSLGRLRTRVQTKTKFQGNQSMLLSPLEISDSAVSRDWPKQPRGFVLAKQPGGRRGYDTEQ